MNAEQLEPCPFCGTRPVRMRVGMFTHPHVAEACLLNGYGWSLIYADWSRADIAAGYGLTVKQVEKIIGPALFADHERQSIPEIDPVWCDQCERRVTQTAMISCQSRFCKAKAMAA